MTIEKIPYLGWSHCYRLVNSAIEAIAITDIGPRIIHFGFLEQENEFWLDPEQAGLSGGNAHRLYGGHRLWHAPEDPQRTYYPDNERVFCEVSPDSILLRQPIEQTTGIQKEIEVRILPDQPGVQVTHRLSNYNLWEVELSPWGLSMMAPGGIAILPHPDRIPWPGRLQPAHSLALWSYTDMSDQRWTWGEKFVLLHQDQAVTKPQKIGMLNDSGWMAYTRSGHLFVKCFQYQPEAKYPDLCSSVELYTDNTFLELETLGPMVSLAPEGSTQHSEYWFLFSDVTGPRDDEQVAQHVLPKVSQALTWIKDIIF